MFGEKNKNDNKKLMHRSGDAIITVRRKLNAMTENW